MIEAVLVPYRQNRINQEREEERQTQKIQTTSRKCMIRFSSNRRKQRHHFRPTHSFAIIPLQIFGNVRVILTTPTEINFRGIREALRAATCKQSVYKHKKQNFKLLPPFFFFPMTEHRQNQPASPRRQQRQPFHTFQYDTTASQQQQQEGETFHFQLLRRQEHEARQNFRNLRPSSIPWSPGQTLAGQSTFHRPLLSPHQSHSDDDAARCWNWMTCRGCHCCCQSSSSRSNRRRDETGVYSHPQYQQQHQQEPGSTAKSCYNFVYILLYVLTFGGLYHYASRCSHQEWTMHPGESRHAATAGFLTNSVQVMSHQEQRSVSPRNNNNGTDSDDVESRGIAVYAVGSRECPPLTGPPVILHSPSQELVLLHNAFEYQYFYLNKGSIMSVTAHQIIGATNILVLKGSKVLARIQGQQPGSNNNNNNNRHTTFMDALFNKVVSSLDFSTEEIMLEQLSWTQDDKGPVEFSFTSPSSDVYVLLYDNAAANEAATLEVQYDMDLKTYNLEGLVPWCSHSAPVPASYSSNNQQVLTPSFIPEDQTATSFTCPPMETSTAGCIIVEAIQHTEDHSQNSTTDNSTTVSYSSFMGLGEGLVEVTVYTTQNWFYIGGLSLLLPSFLASWWYCCRLRNRHRMYTYYHRDEYQDPVHRQHRERSMRPPSRQRQDGPNYHFLPPHHDDQDGSGHEQDTKAQVHREHEDNTDGEQSKGRPKREGRDLESTEVLQEDETTVIPAENILILQNNETLSE